jgi:hypothetical protein
VVTDSPLEKLVNPKSPTRVLVALTPLLKFVNPKSPTRVVVAVTPALLLWNRKVGGSAEAGAASTSSAVTATGARALVMVRMVDSLLQVVLQS